MDYALATFDGYHYAHIKAKEEHQRLSRLRAQAERATRGLARHWNDGRVQ